MLAFVLGTWEIVAIVAVALLLFGSRLPSIARSMGKSVVEFKKGVKDVQDGINDAADPKLESKPSPEVKAEKVTQTKEPVA